MQCKLLRIQIELIQKFVGSIGTNKPNVVVGIYQKVFNILCIRQETTIKIVAIGLVVVGIKTI